MNLARAFIALLVAATVLIVIGSILIGLKESIGYVSLVLGIVGYIIYVAAVVNDASERREERVEP